MEASRAQLNNLKANFDGIKRTYNMAIKGKNATDYRFSYIYSVDGQCIRAIGKFVTRASEFQIQISNINTGVYNDADNTRSYLSGMYSNVGAGIDQFIDYSNKILKASEEVFNEYKSEFSILEKDYNDLVLLTQKRIKSISDDFSFYETYSNLANSNNSTSDIWLAKASEYETNISIGLKNLRTDLTSLGTYIDKLKEILEKGLKKV